ncbi:MAG: hypothetical protein IT436_12510 [Phycisphaerales bacterium]|nr:hypothetical protein [Phycisphaerales bacterium]
MSAAAAYLQRDDLGLRLDRVRLIGIGGQDEWAQPPAERPDAGPPLPDVTAAAAWVASRLIAEGSKADGRLDLLCLDPDGSLCSWLSTTSHQPEVVSALARQSGSSVDPSAGERSLTPLAFYAATPAESSVQALARPDDTTAQAPASAKPGRAPAAPSTDRVAVLATSDASVRLFLDELDRRRIHVSSVVSLWQAMAAAWDPAGPAANASPFPGSARPDVLTVKSDACTAIVLADPRGRIHWCWSVSGRPIAAGSIRARIGLPRRSPEPPDTADLDRLPPEEDTTPTVIVGAEDSARLTSQWLAWSVQLARAPSRIICVMAQTGAQTSAEAGAFGAALGAAWPGASLDMAMVPDPIGATLLRLVSRSSPAAAPAAGDGLTTLSLRPTQAHRRFYTWTAAAVVIAAAVLGVAAWRLQQVAGRLTADAQALRAKADALVDQVDSGLRLEPLGVVVALDGKIAELKKQFAPVQQTEMPVLKELDTLSHVVGIEGLQLREINLSAALPTVIVVADSLKTLEDLLRALNGISGSSVGEWSFGSTRETRVGEKLQIEATFSAQWLPRTGRPATPGGAT